MTRVDFSPCDRPRVIESLRGVEVVDIAAGGAHSACITASGELFTWGKGRYGRLGHGDSEDQLKPKLVSDPRLSFSHRSIMFRIHVVHSGFVSPLKRLEKITVNLKCLDRNQSVYLNPTGFPAQSQ